MSENNFIWTDLSSYIPDESQNFYEAVFDWKYYIEDSYSVAFMGGQEVCGLYETPDFFKQIKMPYFWMSYIQVDDVESIVHKAKELGGIIEIEKDEFYGGNIALIRDPLGAGFTIYDGDKLDSKKHKSGHMISNELQISDIGKVSDFYKGIFSWDIQKTGEGEYEIYSEKNQEKIATILELDNALKGKYEYWSVIFGTPDIAHTTQKILELGGTLISDEGYRKMFTDSSGEAFFYVEQI